MQFTVSDEKKVMFANQSADDSADHESHDPEYKPVLSELPALVEVKTGEEDEDVSDGC